MKGWMACDVGGGEQAMMTSFSHPLSPPPPTQSTEYAAHIRSAFQSAGLAGALRSLPIDDLFALDAVKSVVRTSDGFQPHLVSPEAGLRRLVSNALALADAPVAACVHRIHAVLVGAAREAASKASLLTDASTLDPKRDPLVLPAFEAAVVTAATRALEGWRDDALRVARTVVDMERSYVTAAFFRQRALERVAEDGEGGARATAADDTDSDDGGPGLARSSAAPPPPPASLGGDIKSGYLDKRTSDTATRSSLPDAFRWQRRYFVLTEPKGMLYYFKSPDDPPNYKGAINMRDCRVEDVDADGSVRASGGRGGGRYDLDGGATTAAAGPSLLFRITHKDAGRPVVKGNPAVVLRAESASDKYSWLTRLRAAASGAGASADGSATPVSPSRAGPLASGAAKSAATARRSSGGAGPASPPPPSPPPPPPPPPAPVSGIGSAVEFGTSSKLGPEPVYASGGAGGDAHLAALAADTATYVRTAAATIAVTVPKASVHCQIKRAQAHLLEALYAAVGSLPPDAMEALLVEAGGAGGRRAAAQRAAADLAAALRDVGLAKDAASAAGGGGTVAVPASAVGLAGGAPTRNGARPPPVAVGAGGGAAPSPSPMPRRRPPPAPPGV